MNTRDRFQAGSACYKCRDCGKMTRETGDGESDVLLCHACYGQAGWENTHSDNAHGPDNADPNCPLCQAAGWIFAWISASVGA